MDRIWCRFYSGGERENLANLDDQEGIENSVHTSADIDRGQMSSDAHRDLEQRNGYAGVCSYEACYGNSSFMMDVQVCTFVQ